MQTSWKMIDIGEIVYDDSASISIHIHEPATGLEGKIVAKGVLFFKISHSFGDTEPPYIADIEIKELQPDQPILTMKKFGYNFDAAPKPSQLFHLHAEASIVMEIFSTEPFTFEKTMP